MRTNDFCDIFDSQAEIDSCIAECRDLQEDPKDWCDNHCSLADASADNDGLYSYYYHTVPCSSIPNSGSCTTWSPSSAIDLVGGVYEIDATWFNGVWTNPAPLWTCDDAYFTVSSGKFVVNNASAGEALYELGLRNGDRIVGVNGYDLLSWQDVVIASGMLYFAGEVEYELTIHRGLPAVTVTLDYKLD